MENFESMEGFEMLPRGEGIFADITAEDFARFEQSIESARIDVAPIGVTLAVANDNGTDEGDTPWEREQTSYRTLARSRALAVDMLTSDEYATARANLLSW